MNLSGVFAVLAVVFVSNCITGLHGLKCYECALCNDPFDSSEAQEKECTTSCFKAKVSRGVIRGCADSKIGNECEEATIQGETVEACGCNTDLCNSSAIPNISVSVLVGMFAVVCMMNKLW